MQRTLLAVLAHPDDETFACGGTLARYAASGVRTVLVICTGGEVGEISDPALATPDTLGQVRARELAASASALGIARTVALGYRDSGMAGTPANQNPESFHQADLDEAVARLLEVIRAERPRVMICPNEQGDYGHPDHVKANRVATAAFRASEGAVAKLYYTAFPRSLMARFAEALREMGERPFDEREMVDLDGQPVELGTADELVTTAVDVSAQLEQKRASFQAHRTQFGEASPFMRMDGERFRALWSHEHFRLIEGRRGAPEGEREADLFAGLDSR
jgi:N-acetyl-1-D-myo-inositol-2-amino-2-deoxy-alpha-D-glucopyranoside deacetylase